MGRFVLMYCTAMGSRVIVVVRSITSGSGRRGHSISYHGAEKKEHCITLNLQDTWGGSGSFSKCVVKRNA